ncbi:MAG: DNA-processing protein DprA [Muribaculaceae bacterium]|nr:DNA-processing protein DprA [Muribaculaceae bacterium]
MAVGSSDILYRMAFAGIRGMGVELAQRLLDIIPSEKEFFAISERELKSITGSRSKVWERSFRDEVLRKAEAELRFVEQRKVKVLYFTDENYPKRLLNAIDAPVLLYVIGGCNLNAKHIISIVGTRRSTHYGAAFCDKFVEGLSKMLEGELVIVSGLAYGTDINAHRAALKYNVPTVGVQACGLNKIYPAEHRDDAAHMVQHGGAVVSDYTSQDQIHRGNFLARNRIIAALSDCTVIVESANKGGALVTANIASSYSRDVFAVPGRVGDEFSKGCNRLIMNNQAAAITCAEDLVKAMRWESKLIPETAKELELFPELSAEQQKVVDILRKNGDQHINDLAGLMALPIYRLMATLVELDTKGVIATLPGCRYTLRR